jgi:hypothetical protein
MGNVIGLNWTRYGGCEVNRYNIYRDDGNGTYNFIGFTDSLTTFYVDITAYCPVIYRYKIEAEGICGEGMVRAYSNEITIDHTASVWQQIVELSRATVVLNGQCRQ